MTPASVPQLARLRAAIDSADHILVGAGSGLSTAAGFTYSGERFHRHFADFIAKYNFPDMYTGGFYPFPTLEERWAYWSRYIYINRYDQPAGQPYLDLKSLLHGRDAFVLTTNTDHRFYVAGFDTDRLFCTQGDYGQCQCPVPCHQTVYQNESFVRQMLAEQKDMRIPTKLIPCCPVCGEPLRMNLRNDQAFVEDEYWHGMQSSYLDFVKRTLSGKLLLLEIGVGGNSPGVIKYPFWQLTYGQRNLTYACINDGEAVAPREILDRSILVNGDAGAVLRELLQ